MFSCAKRYLIGLSMLASCVATRSYDCQVRLAPSKHGLHRAWYDVFGRSIQADSESAAVAQCAAQVSKLGWQLDQHNQVNARIRAGHSGEFTEFRM